MNNRTTIYVFLALLLGSWLIELGGGWLVIHWYYGLAWYGQPNSIAANLVGFEHTIVSTTALHKRIHQDWTVSGVLLTIFLVYIALHVVNAVWFGLLYPTRRRWN